MLRHGSRFSKFVLAPLKIGVLAALPLIAGIGFGNDRADYGAASDQASFDIARSNLGDEASAPASASPQSFAAHALAKARDNFACWTRDAGASGRAVSAATCRSERGGSFLAANPGDGRE